MAENRQEIADSPASSDRMGLAIFLATGFAVGRYTPVAPGTVGAVMGAVLAWGIYQLPDVGLPAWVLYTAIVLALNLVGVPLCGEAQRQLGGKDPQEVIWDEICTVPMAFFLVPAALMASPWVLLAGFALHRLFDIGKPPPCRYLERLPGGWGIMADDWMAGIYACVALHMLILAGS